MPGRLYISDTNIWIDFRNAGLLDPLFLLPVTFASTDFVLDELPAMEVDGLLARGLVVETLPGEAMVRLFELRIRHHNSSLADVSSYLVAKDGGHPLITGDGQLRRQAQRDGLEVRGALWLLDQLVDHDIVSPAHAAAALQVMLDAGARLPRTECERRMADWMA